DDHQMTVKFPSTDFFKALKEQMPVSQDKVRRLGFIDTKFGVKIAGNGTGKSYVLEFEVFDRKDVREVDQIDLKSVDFVLEGNADVWREMIENIRRHGEADTGHDINTLTHLSERMKVVYDDPNGHDKL